MNMVSCTPGGDPLPCLDKIFIRFYIVDSLKKPIIDVLNGPFFPESTIIDENGNNLTNKEYLKGGYFILPIAEKGIDSTGTLLRKTYYINLFHDTSTPIDVDTLLLNFTINKTSCDGIGINRINCLYNDSLYSFNYLPDVGSEARFLKVGF